MPLPHAESSVALSPLRLVTLAALAALAAACGGTVEATPDPYAPDGGKHSDAAHDSRSDHTVPADARLDGTSPRDAGTDFKEPGCPDAEIIPPQLECDPYAKPPGGCDAGQACFPYVEYPSTKCGQEVYGSTCAPAGTGTQGSACNGGAQCAGGYVCVISGSGIECVRLCKLDQVGGCPDGLVCDPIDIPGFGGCL